MSELPEQISELSNLERLYVDYNQLEALPQQIVHMTSLKLLFAGDNPLVYPKGDDLLLESCRVPSLKALCGKFVVDRWAGPHKLPESRLPSDLPEYLSQFSKCSYCFKSYIEPVVTALGYLKILWYDALTVRHFFCTYQCWIKYTHNIPVIEPVVLRELAVPRSPVGFRSNDCAVVYLRPERFYNLLHGGLFQYWIAIRNYCG